MSRHGDVSFAWADGEYTFRLGIGELRKLQERCDAGPHEILSRLVTRRWRVDDLRETIRLGLTGGGADDATVRRLLRDHVDERPLLDSVMVAARILEAALAGAPDEQIPKSAAAEEEAKASSAASSPSPPSTAGAESSVSRPGKSIAARSGSSRPSRRDSSRPTAAT